MADAFAPLKVQSLKDACVARLEQLILSGELHIGERLPSEREFAARIGVSRPVLHEALVDLDAKGLVRIEPRRGVFVSDYRRSGSLAMLSSLLAYHEGQFDPAFLRSLLDMRLMLESETARLAALHRSEDQLAELRSLLEREQAAGGDDPAALTGLDFSFHLAIAIASGNHVYPLIINSFRGVYTSLTGAFFGQYAGTPVAAAVRAFHARLVGAIAARDAEAAREIMVGMLRHGEEYLRGAG
jgi:DNA-binding FadR family transcriptional regulator